MDIYTKIIALIVNRVNYKPLIIRYNRKKISLKNVIYFSQENFLKTSFNKCHKIKKPSSGFALLLEQVEDVLKLAEKSYRTYDYMMFLSKATTLLINVLSPYSLDFTIDFLYIEKADSLHRRQEQFVLSYTVEAYRRLLHRFR
jgi:isoleucyl-tRNA synthetase